MQTGRDGGEREGIGHVGRCRPSIAVTPSAMGTRNASAAGEHFVTADSPLTIARTSAKARSLRPAPQPRDRRRALLPGVSAPDQVRGQSRCRRSSA